MRTSLVVVTAVALGLARVDYVAAEGPVKNALRCLAFHVESYSVKDGELTARDETDLPMFQSPMFFRDLDSDRPKQLEENSGRYDWEELKPIASGSGIGNYRSFSRHNSLEVTYYTYNPASRVMHRVLVRSSEGMGDLGPWTNSWTSLLNCSQLSTFIACTTKDNWCDPKLSPGN